MRHLPALLLTLALGALPVLALGQSDVRADPAAPNAAAPAPAVETLRTADGVALRCRRYPRADATPVLLIHGLSSNAQSMDLEGRSLARFLWAEGYDVWCLNLRGAGRGAWRSGGAAYSFDDLVALDVPAAVAHVRAVTGQAPFLVGHSMGGMSSLGWLQGAVREPVAVARRSPRTWRLRRDGDDETALRMRGDADVAAARAREVRGLVAIGSPSRLAWAGPDDRRDRAVGVQRLARDPLVLLYARSQPALPGRRAAALLTLDGLPPAARDLGARVLEPLASALDRGSALEQLFAPGSTSAPILVRALDEALDDLPSPVGRQFLASARRRDLLEAHADDAGRAPYSYADGYARVAAPVLWIVGRQDKLANADVVAEDFTRLGSRDKTLLVTDHGHVDLVLGDAAPATVWRPLLAWLRAR